jgi:Spy/CpxP family protein refolding chaperone
MLGQRNLDRMAQLNPQLNLNEEQRQQRKAIAQRNVAATKAQREQLFQMRQKRLEGSFTDQDRARAQSLRQEIRSTMQAMRGEMRNTLTAEQRSQMDALREQRKQRREGFLNKRKELRNTRP